MAMTATGIVSQRNANLFWIGATEANVAGADYTGVMSSVVGFGDAKLWEVHVVVTGAGAGSALAPLGVFCRLLDSATGSTVDSVGAGHFVQYQTPASGAVIAVIRLEIVRLWRATEYLQVNIPDLESATTTGDVAVYALVQRLRDLS